MKVVPHLLAYLLLAAALSGCGKDDKPQAAKQDGPSAATPKAEAVTDPNVVIADAEMQKWLKYATIKSTEFREYLRVPASVSVDETRVARIGASVTGRITDLKAIVGQNVKKGEVLASLTSTELSVAQAGFLKAFSAKSLAERAAQRAQQLFEADVIGAAELQRRQTELHQAEADMSAAHDQLKVLGVSESGIKRLEKSRTVNSQSLVIATISGSVIDRRVAVGQVVQPADAVFTVADLSRLWVQAEIPEKQSDLIKVGDIVKVQIPALENKTYDGKLIFVSATVNPETRTVTARTEIANADRTIRPAMLATMMIQDRPQVRAVVPADAVVRENNRDFVFVKRAENQYRLTPVNLGAETNGWRPVIDGIKPEETIVVDGAFHLNNERKQNLQ